MIIVVGGILKLNEKTSTRQERNVEKLKVHPEFNLTSLHNDVAILQVRLHRFTNRLLFNTLIFNEF